jgi:extracellular factor (EF) 3-hydroxypalmitic acid methyl ester biosynthesis protein
LQKPLGYAGDYEMVNMMMRDPYEGASLFAKAFNACALSRPPIVAHRNRLRLLSERLLRETLRNLQRPTPVRFLNVGCGPAHEIRAFVREQACSDRADFTLIDFNTETLDHVSQALADCKQQHARRTRVQVLKRSVQMMLKQSGKTANSELGNSFDMVYCAGLFDYLPNPVCRSLIAYFYSLLAPGGLVLVTNVDTHPSRKEMEYFLDWHLIYRDTAELLAIVPSQIAPENVLVERESSGINTFLEIRKPKS